MDPLSGVLMSALPVLLTLAAIEIVILRRTGRPYEWRDAVVSMIDAVIRRFVVLYLGGSILVRVGELLAPYRLGDLPLRDESGIAWLNVAGLALGIEFLYYWFHRWSHEIRWLWATHAVHHSTNTMSLLTAERLGWTQNLSAGTLTFLPLVLVGYRPTDVAYALALNLLYQFWLHTEVVPKLGWFERVFNTPSHHRVHHGANPRYLDANYGGVLIVFDRLFGTFVEESADEPVRFGLVKPLRSYNPIKIALHEWVNIARDIGANWRQPRHLLGYLFGPPGYSHDGSRQTSHQLRELDRAARGLPPGSDAGPGQMHGEAGLRSGIGTPCTRTSTEA